MKIAYITSLYPTASDTFIRVEVENLRRMGFEVHTFSVKRPAPRMLVGESVKSEAAQTQYLLHGGLVRLLTAGVLEALTNPAGFFRAAVLSWKTGATGIRWRLRHLSYLLEAALLARLMRHQGIAHLHNHIGENSATVSMLSSQISGIPYSMTIHGPGIFFHPRIWALGEKIHRSTFTACISLFCRSQCMMFSEPTDWSRLRIVRCGVGATFLDTPPTPVPDVKRLVFVGRLCPEKGATLLLEATHRLISSGTALELELIGDGPIRDQLESQVAKLGIDKHVKFLGWQDSQSVRERVSASRALVLPSLAEGLPVVLMEAMASGRPVVSTRIAGIPELVIPGENGWLVAPGSLDELVEALRQVLATPASQLTAMGQSGAQRVARWHNAVTESTRLAGHLRASIQNGRPAPEEGVFEVGGNFQ